MKGAISFFMGILCKYSVTGTFLFYSHNTKTTTWLDPRLCKKAKAPEDCEDGGEKLGVLFLMYRSHQLLLKPVVIIAPMLACLEDCFCMTL